MRRVTEGRLPCYKPHRPQLFASIIKTISNCQSPQVRSLFLLCTAIFEIDISFCSPGLVDRQKELVNRCVA